MGIVHKVISRGVLALAFTGLLACAHSSKTTVEEIVTEQSAEFDDAGNLVLPIDVTVTPVKGPSGTSYTFKYSSPLPFVDADGNINLRKGVAYKNTVKIVFTLSNDTPENIKFQTPAEDAMFIAWKPLVGGGSPQERYRPVIVENKDDFIKSQGRVEPVFKEVDPEFRRFTLDSNDRQLAVTDENNDGLTYRYNLRFNVDGELVVHDPDLGNGGDPH